MNQFFVLLKPRKELDYSPAQLQRRLEEYRTWVNTISEHHVSDLRLECSGAHILEKDIIETDGPFLETKEIVSGFILLKANNMEQAVEIANTSPLLQYFEMIIRPVVQ